MSRYVLTVPTRYTSKCLTDSHAVEKPFPTGNGKQDYVPYMLNEKQQHENPQQNDAAGTFLLRHFNPLLLCHFNNCLHEISSSAVLKTRSVSVVDTKPKNI